MLLSPTVAWSSSLCTRPSAQPLPSRPCHGKGQRVQTVGLRSPAVAALLPGTRCRAPSVAVAAAERFQGPVSQESNEARDPIGVRQRGDVLGGRYTVDGVLGQGSNAITYRAHASDRQPVAIKAISLRGLRDWKQLDLFQREARTLAGLSHPSIPCYIDYFEEDDERDRAFYIVQESAQGLSLAQMALAGKRPDEGEIRRIATQLLSVLSYLEQLRPPVVHRDIKPANIVLEGGVWGGRVFLVDFGSVQGVATVAAASSAASTIVGTFGFMAPEQFRGAAVPASDLYALGGTLLFLLSGRPPSMFPEERMRINWRSAYVAPNDPLWPALLDGLLEPVAEDRLTAQQALALLDGRAAPYQQQQQPQQQWRQQQRDASTSRQEPPGRVGGFSKLRQRKRRTGWESDEEQDDQVAPWDQQLVTSRPAGSRVVVERRGQRLDIHVPAKGFGADTVVNGSFAIAWNAFVAFWTFGALASGGFLFALFSAPFWFAGVKLAKEAVGGAFMRQHLSIGPQSFSVGQELATFGSKGTPEFSDDDEASGNRSKRREHRGGTADLLGARVVARVIVNGQPYTSVELVEGVRTVHSFGESLETIEHQWLVHEINSHLQMLRGKPVDLSAMPPPEQPTIQNDQAFAQTEDSMWALPADDKDFWNRNGTGSYEYGRSDKKDSRAAADDWNYPPPPPG